MLLQRLTRHIRRQNWIGVLLDLLVVVVGIVVAFQIDRWREARAERALEVTYVRRLIGDVEADIPNIRDSLLLAEQRMGYADLLIAAVRDPAAATAEPARFLIAVNSAAFTNVPALASYTFEDLRSTGNLALIRNPQIRQSLYDYYGFDQESRQWTQLALAGEQHYFTLVAGVADHDQERWVLDRTGDVAHAELEQLWKARLDPQPILAAVERLRSRKAAVDWLPNLRTAQSDSIYENKRRLALAESLLQELREYASRIGDTGGGP